MLRIAVPNKGMLSEPAWNMLAEAGYRLRTNPRQLVVQDPDNGIEPGTTFEDLPEDWVCPLCQEGKEVFEPID